MYTIELGIDDEFDYLPVVYRNYDNALKKAKDEIDGLKISHEPFIGSLYNQLIIKYFDSTIDTITLKNAHIAGYILYDHNKYGHNRILDYVYIHKVEVK